MFKDNAISVELNYQISIVVQTRIALIFLFEVIILTTLRSICKEGIGLHMMQYRTAGLSEQQA